ncbi:hypothetical protein Trydic_g2205 [Trypoxylus dichotomus]
METLETLAEQTFSSVVNCLGDKELKLVAQRTKAVLLVSESVGRASAAEKYLLLRCSLGCSTGRLSGTAPCERETFERSSRVSHENSSSGSQEDIERHNFSQLALFVLARTPPLDLLVQKRSETEQKSDSSGENLCPMSEYMEQRYWASCMDQNTNMGPKAIGHGSYQAYLRRFGTSETDECNYCNAVNTVEYTFFEYPTWTPERQQAKRIIGDVTPITIVASMFENEENWKAVEIMA